MGFGSVGGLEEELIRVAVVATGISLFVTSPAGSAIGILGAVRLKVAGSCTSLLIADGAASCSSAASASKVGVCCI